MRPFYYPMLVILAFVGLTIIAANMRSYEQTEVCVRCGRVKKSVRVRLFGTPFDNRFEEEMTPFTRAWPGALACNDHDWKQTDSYVWRSVSRGYVFLSMSDCLHRLLYEDPSPAILLRKLDPQRAESLLLKLAQEGSQGGGYWISGTRYVVRQQGGLSPTEDLVERLRQGMTQEELRKWDRQERGEDEQEQKR